MSDQPEKELLCHCDCLGDRLRYGFICRQRHTSAALRVREALKQIVEKWRKEQGDYPPSLEGSYAAAAVRCCADELSSLLVEFDPLQGQEKP